MKENKIKELVEWAARLVDNTNYPDGSPVTWDNLSDYEQGNARDLAKEILSHPDLAVIDRKASIRPHVFETDSPLYRSKVFHDGVQACVEKFKSAGYIYSVIPLAEAIKELEDDTNRS